MVQGGAVSPIVTIEPRRRKFHKAITVTMPLPERMSSQYLRRKQENGTKSPSKKDTTTKMPIGKHTNFVGCNNGLLYYDSWLLIMYRILVKFQARQKYVVKFLSKLVNFQAKVAIF